MSFLFPVAVVILLLCGVFGFAAGWPLAGLWGGVAIVGGLVYFLGGDE